MILPISVSGMYMYLGIEGMLCSSLPFRFVSLSLLSMFAFSTNAAAAAAAAAYVQCRFRCVNS